MTFEEALKAMREGKKIQRKTWDNFYIVKIPCKDALLFCYDKISTTEFHLNSADIIADDWEIVDEQPKQPHTCNCSDLKADNENLKKAIDNIEENYRAIIECKNARIDELLGMLKAYREIFDIKPDNNGGD